jgi:hypothetical protein
MNIVEVFATIILIISLSGITLILFRKIPALLELSPKENKSFSLSFNFNVPLFENFLHKLLRKTKILTLKTENKISEAIEHLEKNNKLYKNKFKENYWQGLKNSESAPETEKIKISKDTGKDVKVNIKKSIKKSAPR